MNTVQKAVNYIYVENSHKENSNFFLLLPISGGFFHLTVFHTL